MPHLWVLSLVGASDTVILPRGIPWPLTLWRSMGRKEEEDMEKSTVKKGASVVSLLLGLLAWLGEKFGWISDQAAELLTVGSLASGAVATFA